MTLPPILVTGGTGTLGQQVVARLREAAREVRVLSLRRGTRTRGVRVALRWRGSRAKTDRPHNPILLYKPKR